MLTKTQMEEVWNSKSLFKLKEYSKKHKKFKKFQVTITPYIERVLPQMVYEITASNSSMANMDAYNRAREELQKSKQTYTGFKAHVKEV